MLRRAGSDDLEQLVRLRADACREDAAQARAWVQEIIGLENLLVLQRDAPGPDAMLALVPVYSGQRRGFWLGGAYADAARAGAEVLPRLIDAVLHAGAARGYDFVVTAPQDRARREELMQLGFQPAFSVRRLHRSIPQNLWAQADFDTLTVHRLQERRLHYQPGSIVLPEPTLNGIMRQLYGRGITVVSSQRGYGLFYTSADALHFVELQADNDHSADLLLQAARNHTGLEQAGLVLAGDQRLYQGQGKRCPYGMICYLNEPFPAGEMYFRVLL